MNQKWPAVIVGLTLMMGVLTWVFWLYPALAANKSDILISEILYDPPGTSGCANPGSEWVELYNNSGTTINIKNWQVCDNNACDTITTSDYIIGTGEGVVIAANSADFTNCGYSCSSGHVISLGSFIGNGLADSGDRVYILDDSGTPVQVDEMSYGTDTTFLSPAAPDVADGHSLERDPISQDTDSASDWKEQSSPSACESPTVISLESLEAKPDVHRVSMWFIDTLVGLMAVAGLTILKRRRPH